MNTTNRFEIRFANCTVAPELNGGLCGTSRTRELAESRIATWRRNPAKYGRGIDWTVVEVTAAPKHDS